MIHFGPINPDALQYIGTENACREIGAQCISCVVVQDFVAEICQHLRSLFLIHGYTLLYLQQKPFHPL